MKSNDLNVMDRSRVNLKKPRPFYLRAAFILLYVNLVIFIIYLIDNKNSIDANNAMPFAGVALFVTVAIGVLTSIITGIISIIGAVFFAKEIKKPQKDHQSLNIIGLLIQILIPISILFIINQYWYSITEIFF